MKELLLPFNRDQITKFRAGDEYLLTGVIYTARDQAHLRLTEALAAGEPLPIGLKEAVVYYCGPTDAPAGNPVGSCGPTTSRRMDAFTPALLKAGMRAMIGKGSRSPEVNAAIKKYHGVYFLTYAGCGAYLQSCVTKAAIVAYADLGPEAIRRLDVKRFPVIVGIDASGRSIIKLTH